MYAMESATDVVLAVYFFKRASDECTAASLWAVFMQQECTHEISIKLFS
jgi:hypothetical protein